ncbi:MAG: hypothetical protein Q9217_000751 [Psora testacea]
MDKISATILCLCLLSLMAVTALPIEFPCPDCPAKFRTGHSNTTSSTASTPLNLIDSSSSCPSNPAYSRFDIPNSPLVLELTVRNQLKPEAIRLCLESAEEWLNGQTKSAAMTGPHFDWKDAAGAEVYVASARTRLIWQNVADVVRGLKLYELGSSLHRPVQMEVSFSVTVKSSGHEIGHGHLVRYDQPPAPPMPHESTTSGVVAAPQEAEQQEMAAPVLPLQPIKLPPGPSPLTPEQTYWRTFKSQIVLPTPNNNPVTYISSPLPPLNAPSQVSDHFAVSTGTRVQIYSVRTRKLVKTISRFDDIAHGAEIRRDGRVIVAGDESGAIQAFDINSRAILKTWKEHKQPVWTTKFSPTEPTTLMSASDDRTIRLWDLPSQDSTTTFVGHQDYVRSGAFMPGQASSLLVSGSYDQTVKLWDSRSSSAAVMTFKHASPVENVLPMPSGTTILAAADNQISVLDLVAAKPLQLLRNHQKTVTSICLASNNTRIVSGGLDGHMKIFETTAWNVISGSKYPSPILSLSVIAAGAAHEDRHLAVGMQSGNLSIKTRLSGQQKAKERARQKEMQALIEGKTEELDKKNAKKRPRGYEKRYRGQDFTGEGADIIIEGRRRGNNKPKPWERLLRKGKYAEALDEVLQTASLPMTVTFLTALRHRSATRTALSGRDDVSLQPIYNWVCKHITDPRYVNICVDIGMLILDLYAEHMGESPDIDHLTMRLHKAVRMEVERSQQAWQTQGMLGMLMSAEG